MFNVRLKSLILIVILIVFTFTIVSYAETTFISIGTATMAGTYYSMGNALAVLLNDHIPELKFTSEATAGSAANIKLLGRGEVDMILCLNSTAEDALNSVGAWEGEPKADFLRSVVFVGSWVDHILARKNLNIETVSDIRGCKFSVGAVGSGVEDTARKILKAHDIDYRTEKDIDPQYFGVADSNDQLRNGQIDGMLVTGVVPTSSVIEIMSTNKIMLVPIEEPIADQLCNEIKQFHKVVISANTYPNQDKDILAVALGSHILVHKDLEEDTVYQITKVIMENLEELHALYGNFYDLTSENALLSHVVPLHPGAEKYFREIGLLK